MPAVLQRPMGPSRSRCQATSLTRKCRLSQVIRRRRSGPPGTPRRPEGSTATCAGPAGQKSGRRKSVSVPILESQVSLLGSAVKRGRSASEILFQSGGLPPGRLSTLCPTSRETQINTAFQATISGAAVQHLREQPGPFSQYRCRQRRGI